MNIEEPAALLGYLEKKGLIKAGEKTEIRVLSGGVSNRTVQVNTAGGDSWVLKQGLQKLRVEADWFCNPDRVHREALGLRWLSKMTPVGTVPAFVFEDREHHMLAMEAVPSPHRNWKEMLLAGVLEDQHITQFASLLASIHRESRRHTVELEKTFGDQTYFEDLRLEPYYAFTAASVAPARCFLEALIEETRSRRLTLVHGDFSPKNILVYAGKLVLLDHEVIHFGDPAFDLGFSLTHLLSKAHHVRGRREAFAEAACTYWHTYRAEVDVVDWTRRLEEHIIHHTLGCLLARVCGRSPLEYLSESERLKQSEVVLSLMDDTPEKLEGLVESFVGRV